MSTEFNAVEQLRNLIQGFPDHPVAIDAVLLDYLGRTGESLHDALQINPGIYNALFRGNDQVLGARLLACIVDTEEERSRLLEQCPEVFPNIVHLLNQAQDLEKGGLVVQRDTSELLTAPATYVGHPVSAVIWQLSDLHFGKLSKLSLSPRELAFLVGRIGVDAPALRPNVVIISGDASSTADASEFDAFSRFCEQLSSILWGDMRPERILVVPGNHDVTWHQDGTADHMQGFVEHVAASGVCVTPFGSDHESFDGDRIVVSRYNPSPDTVPPYALVSYPALELEVVLLVSGYFGGDVPRPVRELLRGPRKSRETLQQLLRVDEGSVNHEYLYNLAMLPERRLPLRIAVTHHNPIQYGTECCANRLAPKLLETLHGKSCAILLHGHVHLVEDRRSERPVLSRQTYPVPCTSLAAECIAGNRGMSIHLLGNTDSGRVIDTLLWEMSPDASFKSDGLTWRYRITARDKQVLVSHK
jgi:predicted phosphodiesterase